MVFNTQNYRVFGLCPSSGILETSNSHSWNASSVAVVVRC
jgi:hypothetical protein